MKRTCGFFAFLQNSVFQGEARLWNVRSTAFPSYCNLQVHLLVLRFPTRKIRARGSALASYLVRRFPAVQQIEGGNPPSRVQALFWVSNCSTRHILVGRTAFVSLPLLDSVRLLWQARLWAFYCTDVIEKCPSTGKQTSKLIVFVPWNLYFSNVAIVMKHMFPPNYKVSTNKWCAKHVLASAKTLYSAYNVYVKENTWWYRFEWLNQYKTVIIIKLCGGGTLQMLKCKVA